MKRVSVQPADLAKYFGRHLVGLYWAVRRIHREPEELELDGSIASAFVMAVHGRWLLVTAGHALKDINNEISRGNEVQCRLYDCFGKDTKSFRPVVMAYSTCDATIVGNCDDVDYGIYWLGSNVRQNLVSNGIEPVTPDRWTSEPEEFDRYFLMGVPGEWITPCLDASTGLLFPRSVSSALISFDRTHTPPEELKTPTPRIYGTVPKELVAIPSGLKLQLSSIKGMSGGPIFGVKRVEGGHKYWFIGVQSGWHRPSRVLAACPFKAFADHVKHAFDEHLLAAADTSSGWKGTGSRPDPSV